MTGDCELCVS